MNHIQAYDASAVRNLQINNCASELLDAGQLTPPQYQQVQQEFPVEFKQPNFFVRIGLFLFTGLCIIFSIAFITFLTGKFDSTDKGWGGLLLFFAITLTLLNENFIRNRRWYRQGSDNALSYASIFCFVVGINFFLDSNSILSYAVLSLIFLTVGTIRYGDPILAVSAFIALLNSFTSAFTESESPRLALPFVYATLAATVYFFAKTAAKQPNRFYWEDCFTVLEIAGLLVFYAAVNYFVVAETVLMNMDKTIPSPFNYLFAVLTAVVPVAYLVMGIKNKDRILWVMGSLGIVASVMTYRYYHSILPIEWALTLAGMAFIGLAVFLIKYLKTPQNGFVYLHKRHKSNIIESLVMNQLLQNTTTSSIPESNIKFGGGNFDGGGAEGDI